jgi:hypothetical protein
MSSDAQALGGGHAAPGHFINELTSFSPTAISSGRRSVSKLRPGAPAPVLFRQPSRGVTTRTPNIARTDKPQPQRELVDKNFVIRLGPWIVAITAL